MPRGLSITKAGTFRWRPSEPSATRAAAFPSPGPPSTSGRRADAMAARTATASAADSGMGSGRPQVEAECPASDTSGPSAPSVACAGCAGCAAWAASPTRAASVMSAGSAGGSMRASSRSTGRLIWTGPARPVRARLAARSSIGPRPSTCCAVHAAFVMGAATAAWSSAWKAPRPASCVPAWPDSSSMGASLACATGSAAQAFVWPCPPVTSATPSALPSLAYASAMCTAAASWRTWMSRIELPVKAS